MTSKVISNRINDLKIIFELESDTDISDIIVKIKYITEFTNSQIANIMGYSAPTRISEFIHEKQIPSNQGITALYYWVSINIDFLRACMEAQDMDFVETTLIEIITPKNPLKN